MQRGLPAPQYSRPSCTTVRRAEHGHSLEITQRLSTNRAPVSSAAWTAARQATPSRTACSDRWRRKQPVLRSRCFYSTTPLPASGSSGSLHFLAYSQLLASAIGPAPAVREHLRAK